MNNRTLFFSRRALARRWPCAIFERSSRVRVLFRGRVALCARSRRGLERKFLRHRRLVAPRRSVGTVQFSVPLLAHLSSAFLSREVRFQTGRRRLRDSHGRRRRRGARHRLERAVSQIALAFRLSLGFENLLLASRPHLGALDERRRRLRRARRSTHQTRVNLPRFSRNCRRERAMRVDLGQLGALPRRQRRRGRRRAGVGELLLVGFFAVCLRPLLL